MNNHHKIIVISGPSGSGKTTIVNAMLDQIKVLRFSVSATTRAKRESETDKTDYYFLTEEEFRSKIYNIELLEYEEVYPGILYGTLKTEIDRIFNSGKIPILDVDVKGAIHIKKIYGNSVLTIFIHPGSIEILRKRLEKRNSENTRNIEERLKRAKSELTFEKQFDHIVCNQEELADTIRQAGELIMNFLIQKT